MDFFSYKINKSGWTWIEPCSLETCIIELGNGKTILMISSTKRACVPLLIQWKNIDLTSMNFFLYKKNGEREREIREELHDCWLDLTEQKWIFPVVIYNWTNNGGKLIAWFPSFSVNLNFLWACVVKSIEKGKIEMGNLLG